MEYVESRLSEWGRWCCRQESGTAGYPRRTVLGKLRADGGILSRSRDASVVPLDSGAEHMERIVTRLRAVRHEWAMVLQKRYVDDMTRRQIALAMQSSEGSVTIMLSSAKAWVGGKMDRS